MSPWCVFYRSLGVAALTFRTVLTRHQGYDQYNTLQNKRLHCVGRLLLPTGSAEEANKIVIFLLALAGAAPCAFAQSTSLSTNEWSEKCTSCGKTVFHYAYSFDAEDYAVLSALLKTKPDGEAYIMARAVGKFRHPQT